MYDDLGTIPYRIGIFLSCRIISLGMTRTQDIPLSSKIYLGQINPHVNIKPFLFLFCFTSDLLMSFEGVIRGRGCSYYVLILKRI